MKAIYDNEIWSVTETCAGKDIPKTSFGLAGQPGRDNNVEQDWLQLNGLIWVPSDARGLAVDPTDGEVEGTSTIDHPPGLGGNRGRAQHQPQNETRP